MKFTPSIIIAMLAAVSAIGVGLFIYFSNSKPAETVGPSATDIKARAAIPVPKIPFTDITTSAGITFQHVNGAYGRKFLPETMGGGVAVLDYDNDGKPDILFINSRPWPGTANNRPAPTMALYHNLGDGKFDDVTEKMGLNIPLFGMGVCCGDFNNDGWIDIFVTAVGGGKLFQNIGGKKFVDVTDAAHVGGGSGLPDGVSRSAFERWDKSFAWPTSATFLDFDGDGKLDLFVCHYINWSPAIDIEKDFQLDGGLRAYGRPSAYEGVQCALYRNIDGMRFEDVSEKVGLRVMEPTAIGRNARLRPVAKSLGAIACDLDEDGWPDIVVANDTERNFFFHNIAGPNDERRFEEIGLRSGLAFAGAAARGGMGIDFGESPPFGRAVMVANFAEEPTSFFVQDRPKSLAFSDLANAFGIAVPTRSPLKFGTMFLDLDLDGRLDLFTNNGHLEPDIAKVRTEQSYKQSPQLFWNTGQKDRCFEPATAAECGPDLFQPLVGRGCAFADFDGNGTLDLVLTANGGPARLLRNDCDLKNHWVRLTLEGDGVHSNRSAIGAVVTLEAGGEVQRRSVAGARGYLSQSELTLTFGLGKTTIIDKVTIQWPGKNAGPPTVLKDVEIDRVRVVRQGD